MPKDKDVSPSSRMVRRQDSDRGLQEEAQKKLDIAQERSVEVMSTIIVAADANAQYKGAKHPDSKVNSKQYREEVKKDFERASEEGIDLEGVKPLAAKEAFKLANERLKKEREDLKDRTDLNKNIKGADVEADPKTPEPYKPKLKFSKSADEMLFNLKSPPKNAALTEGVDDKGIKREDRKSKPEIPDDKNTSDGKNKKKKGLDEDTIRALFNAGLKPPLDDFPEYDKKKRPSRSQSDPELNNDINRFDQDKSIEKDSASKSGGLGRPQRRGSNEFKEELDDIKGTIQDAQKKESGKKEATKDQGRDAEKSGGFASMVGKRDSGPPKPPSRGGRG
jgi:hypothetical protein